MPTCARRWLAGPTAVLMAIVLIAVATADGAAAHFLLQSRGEMVEAAGFANTSAGPALAATAEATCLTAGSGPAGEAPCQIDFTAAPPAGVRRPATGRYARLRGEDLSGRPVRLLDRPPNRLPV